MRITWFISSRKEFSHEESPQLDEIKSLKEKIISLENRMLWLFYRINGVPLHKIKAILFIFSKINPNHTRDTKKNVFNGEITPNKD